MKKTLLPLLFVALFGVAGVAQTGLTLSDPQGNPIPNNSTLVQNGVPEDAELVTYLWVKNNTGHSIDVKAKKVELSLLASTNVTFCWAGNCFPPNVFESIGTTTIAAGATATEFSGHYAPSLQKGQTRVQWVFWDVADPNNSVSVNVDYNTFPVGTEEITASRIIKAFPNPASSSVTLTYALRETGNARIVLRNILGVEIRSEVVADATGKVVFNVSNLSDGIYFYTLMIGEESTSTGKIVVKH